MSSRAKGGATRVSIPSGVNKTIENIKEITGNNHSEDDIYAMLKECNMDPNETAQKLLLLDTFHEVKRRRDRRKENPIKEPVDQKWKPGTQTRPNRVGRVNYVARYSSQDAVTGRRPDLIENASNIPDKSNTKVLQVSVLESKKNGSPSLESEAASFSNGPSNVASHNVVLMPEEPAFPAGVFHQSDEITSKEKSHEALQPSFLAGSQNLPLPDEFGASQREPKRATSSDIGPSDFAISKLPREIPNDLHGVSKTQHFESQPTSSGSKAEHLSQVSGQQKEWKPKSSHSHAGLSEGSAMSIETLPESLATSIAISSKEETLELQRKLKDVNFEEKKNVVIPNHLQVPEVKKLGFCFGSFDAGFELDMNKSGVEENDRNPPLLSESSNPDDQAIKELKFRRENAILQADDPDRGYSDHPRTPVQLQSSATVELTEPNMEAAQESDQHTPFDAPSSYNHGLMPPRVSSQVTTLEGLDSHARDPTLLSGFILPQSVDPASYYAQFYRSGFMDSDGRISPFHAAGVANKYNGNNTLISSQSAHHQELQGSGQRVSPPPAQLVTQAAGVMHSSIPATQQSLPIFRQPSGVHLPHYPPNFIPYAPYFSPFYVPPPAIHQFLSNGTFPQQHQTGNMYPSATGTSSKYSASQLKHGNTGNPAHVGLTGSYGAYGLSTINYTSSAPSPTVTPGSTDDAAAPHVKENNIYITGQQNEGSGAWFTTPSGDIGSLPANAFYNLPQSQLSFNPAQPGHGAFTGIFHPAQGVPAAAAANVHPILQQSQSITSHGDMVGQPVNIYQQPQHAQPNWPSNY